MLLKALICSALFLSPAISSSVAAREAATTAGSSSLAELALQQILSVASPIFGVYDYNETALNTSTWMSRYPDSTQLIHMNIPGTHDSSTWNYSQATQDSLLHITAVDGVVPAPAAIYRGQEKSYFDMLNDGIRAFDIRYSFDATNSSLVVYHSAALQSETALLEDIMFGFYQWLEDHPSETLLLSFSKSSSSISSCGLKPMT
jgi:1-phosphatidylinositol phosphodiesterase